MSPKKDTPATATRLDSSSERVLGLLDLFTLEKPEWTVDMLVDHQGLAKATIYRYVKALVDTGFLAPAGSGAYSLGPRFIEMDRQIRIADPLLQIAPAVMQETSALFHGGQLLSRFYSSRVLCIHETFDDDRIQSSFERGRPFSLFLGAPSRIILANFPVYQLQRLFLFHSEEIAEAKLGNNWAEFRDRMKAIRKTGYAVASDIDKTLIGVSAPIFRGQDSITASLCLVRVRKETSEQQIEELGQIAIDAAARISRHLQQRELQQQSPEPTKRARKPKSEDTAPKAKKRSTRKSVDA